MRDTLTRSSRMIFNIRYKVRICILSLNNSLALKCKSYCSIEKSTNHCEYRKVQILLLNIHHVAEENNSKSSINACLKYQRLMTMYMEYTYSIINIGFWQGTSNGYQWGWRCQNKIISRYLFTKQTLDPRWRLDFLQAAYNSN